MVGLEWWSFEILAFIAGYISVPAQASHVILIISLASIITIGRGFKSAATVLIGKQIGRNNMKMAQEYFKVLMIVAWFATVIAVTLVVSLRNQFMLFFTTQEQVIQQC